MREAREKRKTLGARPSRFFLAVSAKAHRNTGKNKNIQIQASRHFDRMSVAHFMGF